MTTYKNSGIEVVAPTTAPTGVASATSGSLDAAGAIYTYKVTYVNAYGETTPSSASSNLTTTSTQAFDITIPVSPDASVTSRKVYRTQGGVAGTWLFLTTIANNTTTTFTDTTADGSLGAGIPPTTNTAMTSQINYGNCKFNQPLEFSGVAVITAGTTQTQAGATAIGLNQFASVTTGLASDGVILPLLNSYMIGMGILITNKSNVILKVYPNTNQTINSGGSNASVDHAASGAGVGAVMSRWYVATTATNWVQV